MIENLVNATFKSQRRNGVEKAIQMQTEQIILTYLLSSSVDEQVSYPARIMITSVNAEFRKWLEDKVKSATDAVERAHWQLAIDRFKSPEKAKPTLHAAPPPGAPIGCEDIH